MPLLDRVRRFVAAHQLAGPRTRLVVALSGGSDSVALACLLRELAAAGELQIAGAAHFNHQLRDTADRDEQFAARLAESFGWSFSVDRADVAARARRERRSIEHAARSARHEFFERARAALAGDVVAVGHTRDDQAETVLMRLIRGAGPKGLAAMHPSRGFIVRPLLDCRRYELREYLVEQQRGYVDDESNADVRIPRNRVRAELVPLLETRFNPSIVEALANEAELARETWTWLESAASALIDADLAAGEKAGAGRTTMTLSVAALLEAPPPVRRFALWRAMSEVSEGRPIAFDHVQAGLAALGEDGPRSLDLPGHTLERLGSQLVLRGTAGAGVDRAAGDAAVRFDSVLPVPGEVVVPHAGCVLLAEEMPAPFSVENPAGDRTMARVRRDRHVGPWRVRTRRPGDRFRPIGVGGKKKLQDFFVDRKIARARRDLVPLVVDHEDRIVWVAGFAIDEAFRVTDPAQGVITLRLQFLGGFA